LLGALDVCEKFGVRDGFTVCQWYARRCAVRVQVRADVLVCGAGVHKKSLSAVSVLGPESRLTGFQDSEPIHFSGGELRGLGSLSPFFLSSSPVH
jgi:hypothetical protein